MKSELYFECHITFDPDYLISSEVMEEIAGRFGFKVATFLMKKDGPQPDAFCSARDSHYERLVARCGDMLRTLRDMNLKVKRYKIENTLMDSKFEGDVLRIGLGGNLIRGELWQSTS